MKKTRYTEEQIAFALKQAEIWHLYWEGIKNRKFQKVCGTKTGVLIASEAENVA